MTTSLKPSSPRLPFFDNLRSVMILLVLIFHSGASYGSMVGFWPFREANPVEFVDILMLLFDVFMMSILFFIAGYFALPSLRRHGRRRFLAGKLKRLGVPWLVIVILLLPLLDYLHYYLQASSAGQHIRGYDSHWWLSMRKIAEFTFDRMQMSEYLDMTRHFYQRYMWFLSLLLLFFVLLWPLYEARNRWGKPRDRPAAQRRPSSWPVLAVLGVAAAASVALFAVVKLFVSSPANPFDMVWFSLGNIFQFELAKLAFYVPAFGLGVYASSKGWFTGEKDFGPPWVWGGVLLLLTIANLFVGRGLSRSVDPSLGLQIAFLVLYPVWTLSFLGWFIALASRRWNSSSTFSRELASNSYNMYLVHYMFVMTLPVALAGWSTGPVLVKFAIVSLATIVLSYGMSQYVMRRFSRFVVLGLAAANIILSAVV